MKIAAIVPAKDEAPTIGRVIAALQSSPFVRRVLVVDDGSSDATCAVAKRCGATVLRAAKNKGKGQAMLAGFPDGASGRSGNRRATGYPSLVLG